jgi:hypothetical protein
MELENSLASDAEQEFERHKDAAYRLQAIQQQRIGTEIVYAFRNVIADHLVYVELDLIGGVSKDAPIDPHDLRRCVLLGFLWHCTNWDEDDGAHQKPKAHFDVEAAKDCANNKESFFLAHYFCSFMVELANRVIADLLGQIGEVMAENVNIRQQVLGMAAPSHQLESVANVKQYEADLWEVAR